MQRTAQLLKSGSVAKVPEGARNNNKREERAVCRDCLLALLQWPQNNGNSNNNTGTSNANCLLQEEEGWGKRREKEKEK